MASLMTMTIANAQTIKDDIQASEKRAAELKKLMDNQPKACGVAEIDNYATAINNAAVLAIGNSEKMSNLYYREIGETKDGVTEVKEQKPTAQDWTELGAGIAGEGTLLKKAQESAEAAAKKLQAMGEEAKNAGNPMAKAKAAKQVKAATAVVAYGKDALPILVNETAAQAKAIKQIIDTVKSGKRL